MKALLEGLRGLGAARLGAMAAVSVGMLGLLALLAIRGATQPMALLYGDLDLKEAGQAVDLLDHAHIPHREEAGGTTILVPADQVARARLLLAKDGLPSGGSIGYEIFDHTDGLTETAFQQQINETRALEGELERTIRAINGVRAVRVNLVLPHREPFARDAQPAQASVLLTMAGAMPLDHEGVQAILNLVAAAVPGLRPEHIAIIDSRGDLLARAGEPVGAIGAAQTAESLRRATELQLSRAVEEMLEPTLGVGHVRAEAAVEMNFDQVQEKQETFNPDQQVVRSTQTSSDNSKTTEANKSVSVQNNLPNANAGQTGSGSQEQRRDETTNYEIGNTVRTLVHQEPQISRISLAVLVDGVETRQPDGKLVYRDRTPAELHRIETLVKSAIGFNAKRGDTVDVVSMRFADTAEPLPPPAPTFLGVHLERSDIMRLAETGLFGLLVLLALLLVARPMALRIAAPPALAGPDAAGGAGPDAVLAGPGATGSSVAALPPGAVATALPAPAGTLLVEDERMVDIANVEGQMRASSIRRLADLVDKHPEESLSIVRGWMAREAL
ncbi:MAG TPA: flagellar basal-body MS-ring/collar protein FliF [Acetobacteraceae bacterium]|nr:flagellar basal-body MS-ring/collar protein FliF [Acetobacteraceae bacterium]